MMSVWKRCKVLIVAFVAGHITGREMLSEMLVSLALRVARLQVEG